MKYKLISIFIYTIMFTTLFGCSSSNTSVTSELEQKFRGMLLLDDMNKSLQINPDSKQGNFPPNSKIPLIIFNKSPYSIAIEEDSKITLLMIRDDEWVEVPNDMVYIGTVVMSPQGTPLLDLGYTWVMPNPDENLLPLNKEGDLLRVVVQGEILKNDAPTGNFVGAYVDINLVSR